MPGDSLPSWYGRYRDLRNRQDAAGNLSNDERAELDNLEVKLGEVASGSAGELRNAAAPGHDPGLIQSILATPGSRKFGFTAANLAQMNPSAVTQLAAGLGLGAGGSSGASPPTAAPPPPRPPSLADAAPSLGANSAGGSPVTAFDRPQAVVIMGPRPVPVRIEGEVPGRGGGEPGAARGRTGGNDGNSLLDALAQPSPGRNQSGPNLAHLLQRFRGIGARLTGGLRRAGGAARGGLQRASAARGAASAGRLAAVAGGAAEGAAAGGAPGAVAGGLGAAAGGSAAAAGGALAVLGAVGTVAGAAVAGVGALAVATVEAGKAVYAFARAQEAEVRKLAEVGGVQAAAVARLDAERIGRDVKTASETGGSSQELIESLSKFEDALQPIESVLTNLANTVGSSLLDTATEVVKFVEPLANLLIDIYNALPGRSIDKGQLKHRENESALDQIRALDDEAWRRTQPQWPAGNRGRR
jgi:hypothetical protein